jgi:two-component sensor histidine kinase
MDGILRFFDDPVLLVDRHGCLLDMNRPASALLGDAASPGTTGLFGMMDGLRELLGLASGTGEVVPGALTLPGASGGHQRFRARAMVTLRSGAELRFAVQLMDSREDKFSLLTQRVAELNDEIKARRSVQARLEEAVAHRQILYRELQHRVKNHLQVMLSLFAAAREEAQDPVHAAAIGNLEDKLLAICEAQQLMYREENAAALPAEELLNALARVFSALGREGVRVTVESESVPIPNEAAFPVALIVNELLSNALKHGPSGEGGRIVISLRRDGKDFELKVEDNGPGFIVAESGRRFSGLGLVRGLCRQLGGQLTVHSPPGAVVVVRFSAAE